MLVVISDLHFVDGTAGEHNLASGAFTSVFLSGIVSLAKRKNASELKLLLLGDIVDLIRTEHWLTVPESDRPWGEHGLADVRKASGGDLVRDTPTEAACLRILGELTEPGETPEDTIIAKNWETFRFFREGLTEALEAEMGPGFPVDVIYLPGNHDRLCNLYPAVRDRLRDAFGLTVTAETAIGDADGDDWWYRDDFLDAAYGVYGRHGHQYDSWNYGDRNDHTRRGHLQCSIGDVLATEFAVRIPWQVQRLKEEGRLSGVSDSLVANLKDMDNVRPLSSVMEWFYYRIKREDTGAIRDALDDGFDQVLKDILKIGFVQGWRSPDTRVDDILRAAGSRWLRWIPNALLDRLEAEDLLPMFLGKSGTPTDPAQDPFTKAAYDEGIWRSNPEIHYILYGHTHHPLVRPLDILDGREVTYINTGTWRDRIYKTVPFDKAPDFASIKQMTYAVFYREGEDPGRIPGTTSFDMWSGWKRKAYA